MKILGYEMPESAIQAVEHRMTAGSFEAFDVRRVLLAEFRRHPKGGPKDPFRVADSAATRLIRLYADKGAIRRVSGTRRWSPKRNEPTQRAAVGVIGSLSLYLTADQLMRPWLGVDPAASSALIE